LVRCACKQPSKENIVGLILLILVILLLVGALPRWGYSSGWGYGPSGLLGLILIIVLILLLMGRL
jgi:Sec-independent protein translocase protein TatA